MKIIDRFLPAIVLISVLMGLVSIFRIGYCCGEVHFIKVLKVERVEPSFVVATLDGVEHLFGID